MEDRKGDGCYGIRSEKVVCLPYCIAPVISFRKGSLSIAQTEGDVATNYLPVNGRFAATDITELLIQRVLILFLGIYVLSQKFFVQLHVENEENGDGEMDNEGDWYLRHWRPGSVWGIEY